MGKLRLIVRTRKQGSRIESVPLKQLIKMSHLGHKRWSFEVVGDVGWLILETK